MSVGFSKMKHPDFLSLISNHDIIAIFESKLDDTDAVDVPALDDVVINMKLI